MKAMTNTHYHAGFGLPTAIFIILIMSLIAIVITRQSQVSAELYSRNFLSTQALLAAEAGIELNLTRLELEGSCLGSMPIIFTATGLQGCSANIACQSRVVDSKTFTDVTSTGTCGQGIDACARRIRVKFWQ